MINKWGNYWLDLLEFEKYIKTRMEDSIDIFLGKRYSSLMKLRMMVNEAIKDCMDMLSEEENRFLDVDYGITLDFDHDTFNGYVIDFVHCN
jgi:hypothetical protein